jgi:hypothetical protein
MKATCDTGARRVRARGLQAILRAAAETETCKEISKIGLSWMKEALDFSFLSSIVSK